MVIVVAVVKLCCFMYPLVCFAQRKYFAEVVPSDYLLPHGNTDIAVLVIK